jgi:hypothetical protein
MELKTDHRTTPNGAQYISRSFERPGLLAWVVVGDIESFTLWVDELMTFYPGDVREIAAALNELADLLEVS